MRYTLEDRSWSYIEILLSHQRINGKTLSKLNGCLLATWWHHLKSFFFFLFLSLMTSQCRTDDLNQTWNRYMDETSARKKKRRSHNPCPLFDNAGIITSFSTDLSWAQFQFKRRTFSKFDAQKLIRYNEPFLIISVCNLCAVLS